MPVNLETYTGWGRVLSAAGGRTRPERMQALREDFAASKGPAIGNLRSYGDAALHSDGQAIDMTRLDRMLGFDAETGVLECEAGVTLSDIMDTFAPKGWLPMVMPGTGFATVGGAIAADVHGKNHHGAGSMRASVEAIRLIGADGVARWISETEEADVFRATFGGMGLTGIIEAARLRLAPCPSEYMEVRERRIGNLAEYIEAFEESRATYAVGWIDAAAKGSAMGRGILEEAEFSARAEPVAKAGKPKKIPRQAPSFLLSPPVVKLFNWLYFHRIAKAGKMHSRTLQDFFFPLDRIRDWNKLYGKRGFHQFQCVLPPDAAALVLDQMLRKISDSGLAAPLAVLKKMGEGNDSPMSFPMEGYTLAVDFPNRDKAVDLIAELEARVAEVGGRVYLAKDALATPGAVERMYPEIGSFRDVVRRVDPEGVFETDQARRLKLRGNA